MRIKQQEKEKILQRKGWVYLLILLRLSSWVCSGAWATGMHLLPQALLAIAAAVLLAAPCSAECRRESAEAKRKRICQNKGRGRGNMHGK